MHCAQRSDLVSSRHHLEAQGEQFGCFRCGAFLPPVSQGHGSDLCESCDEADAVRVAAEIAALEAAEGR